MKLLTLLAIATMAVFSVSCLTEQKAVDFLTKRGQLPRICADLYPPVVTPGKIVHTSDTVLQEGPQVPCPPAPVDSAGKQKIVYVKCPPSIFVHDTISQHDTIENFARIEAQGRQIDSLIVVAKVREAAEKKAEKQAKNRLFGLIGLSGIIGAGLFLKLKNII